ncbi:glutaredoxin-related protein 5, mitochondrial [Daphnia magna]|nr:glutaredoxin-related protein 5, mitochondrial [Daphnia magna]
MTTAIQRCSKAFFQSAVLKKHFSVSRYSTVIPKEQFEQMVKKNKVVVFMKGVPEQPMCGFSNAVVQIFRMHGVTNYDAHNVLADENMRQGIKEFSNWPTIPQIFIGGEFVGGCDILLQMHKNGELIEELQKVGIQSALIEQEDKKE